MNLNNAIGKFGALMIDVINFVKSTLVEVDDGFVEWLAKNDGGRSALRSAVETAVKSLVEEYRRFKLNCDRIINFDNSAVFCPQGLTVAPNSHQITSRIKGKKRFGEVKIGLYLDACQKGGRCIKGFELKKQLEGQEVYGAQLLDFYLANPDLIPEELKTSRRIYFWGTIYCYVGAGDALYVRCLSWDVAGWTSVFSRLEYGWDDDRPAAVSASPQG